MTDRATTERTLRRAGLRDVEPVTALERLLFGADAWTQSQVRQELTGEHRYAWVVGEVGYAVVSQVADTVDLHRIAVHPHHQRQGLARALLAAAVKAARDAGAARMLLEVAATNHEALAFYAVEGFTEIDRRRGYYRDGADAVVMERGLNG